MITTTKEEALSFAITSDYNVSPGMSMVIVTILHMKEIKKDSYANTTA